jgi:nitroimidazol reductase NimA-like FMN-containing flavoprotein (pyridoxamine 5'-phosphate oxidase superfamily)
MTAELDRSNKSLEVLSESQCRELLASRDLGRIAFSIGGQPEILPINYAADGLVVVFRTAQDTIMMGALSGRVAFEVDSWDPQTRVGWSVVLKGVAEEVARGGRPFLRRIARTPGVSARPKLPVRVGTFGPIDTPSARPR